MTSLYAQKTITLTQLTRFETQLLITTTSMNGIREVPKPLSLPILQLWLSADTVVSPILCFTLEQIIIIKYMEALSS